MSKRHTSLFYKTLLPIVMVMLMQTGLIYGAIYFSGSISQLETNAFDILGERVTVGANGLRNDMVQRWSNTSQVADEVEECLAASGWNSHSDWKETETLLQDCADPLLLLMRRNTVTGAFLVLENGRENKPGLYFRDGDPDANPADTSDILAGRGPAAVTQSKNIALGSIWQPNFSLGDWEAEDTAFYYAPYLAALENPELSAGDLSFWSQPFYLTPNSVVESTQIITYSIPLRGTDGQPVGVLGVELSLDYLKKHLPSSDLGNSASSGFLVAVVPSDIDRSIEFQATPVFTTGSYFTRAVGRHPEVTLTPLPGREGFYQLLGSNGESFYGACCPISLYNSYTPSSGDQWLVAGFTEESVLLDFPRQFSRLVGFLALFTLIVGSVVVCIMVSKTITLPIVHLAQRLRHADPNQPICLGKVEIDEIDELTGAVENLSERVADASQRLSQILEMAGMAIGAFEYHWEQDKVFYTDRFFSILRLPCQGESDFLAGDVFRECLAPLAQKRERKGEDGNWQLYQLGEEASPYWVRMNLVYTKNAVLGMVIDVTEEVLEKRKLEHDRDYDLLTNIYNRGAFQRTVEPLFDRPEKLGIAAVVVVDLDNLKFINDTYGHDYGDEYIRSMAGVLRRFSAPNVLVCRQAGDEFLLFFHGYEKRESILEICNELWRVLYRTLIYLPDGTSVPLRASAGMSWYPKDGQTMDDLIRFADFAMYRVKHTNKGEMSEFDIKSYNQESYLLHCREELNNILEQFRVDYYFQPILDAKTGEIFAYEALMRPESESIRTPMALLSLARSQSKLYQVEHMTMVRALECFTQLSIATQSECKLFVNSIPNQLLRPADLADFESRFAPYLSRLVIELTEDERMEVENIQKRRDLMERLGCEVALDDFGMGHSGDARLLYQQPNYVKVDSSIIRGIHQDADRRQILINLLGYTHSRGIQVVAEGIESQGELEELIRLKVDYLQGYYLGKPTPEPALTLPHVKEQILTLVEKIDE